MYFSITRILYFSATLLLCWGCSTQRNRWINKAYHNTTTRFNIYFNARESLKEGVMTVESGRKEDYTKLLPVFINPDEAASRSIYPQMDRTIKKCSKGIQRHSMNIKEIEYCSWIDDCFLLMGKAYFYKREFYQAIENFEFLAKEYKKKEYTERKKDIETGNIATLWLVRTHLEMKNYDKAGNVLSLLHGDKKYPHEYKGELAELEADFYIRREDYTGAIPHLKTAISLQKKRKRRVRLVFILAQLYQQTGNRKMASDFYSQVINMNPPYEMEFYARINQANAFEAGSGDSDEIKKKLLKMAKDIKNKEYFDLIYYALADMEIRNNNKPKGIEYLQLSVQTSVSNTQQKALSCLKLADLYYNDRNFEPSQSYYDSTVSYLNKEHKEYPEALNRRNSLTRLVKYLNTIEREDSLQQVAALSEKERIRLIDNMIQAVLDKEEQERQDQANAALLPQRATPQEQQQNQQAGGGGWYFYNPSALSFGFSEFIRIWGDRPLEDNWRRKNKSSAISSFEDNSASLEPLEDKDTSAGANNMKDKNNYLKNLPLTKEKLAKSHGKIAEALFESGTIYKEQLGDKEQAIISFEKLVQRYDTSKYSPASSYQLYRIYSANGNQTKADYYKNKIITQFPETDYAKILLNPDHFKQIQSEQSKIAEYYKSSYRFYQNQAWHQALLHCQASDSLYPNNFLRPKFHYLHALCIGKTGTLSEFEQALDSVVKQHPADDVAKEAKNILEYIRKSANSKPVEDARRQSLYSTNTDGNHTCLLIVPEQAMKIDDVKATIANFNTKYFSSTTLEITSLLLSPDSHIVSIRIFSNMEKAMNYYMAFLENQDMLDEINALNLPLFVISYENYATFYNQKKVEDYLTFFNKVYLKK